MICNLNALASPNNASNIEGEREAAEETGACGSTTGANVDSMTGAESNWAFTVVGPVGRVQISRRSGLFRTRRAIRGCAMDHQELPCWSSRRVDR